MLNFLGTITRYIPKKDIMQIIPGMLFEVIEDYYNAEEISDSDKKKIQDLIDICKKGILCLEVANNILNDILNGNPRQPSELKKLRNWSVGNPTNFT